MSGPGFVYAIRNPFMPGLLKIGCTTRTPMERCRELFTTGVPCKFVVVAAFYVEDATEAESVVHEALEDFRVTPEREFFSVSTSQALIAMLSAVELDDVVVSMGGHVIDGDHLEWLAWKSGRSMTEVHRALTELSPYAIGRLCQVIDEGRSLECITTGASVSE